MTARSRLPGAALAIALVAVACSPAPSPLPSSPVSSSSPASSTAAPTATLPATAPPESPSPAPTAAAFGIDGLPVAGASAALPVAVMIDDNLPARPQSGFNAASIVYQAPADGGEDRYMLVFQGASAPDIGPVRSGRPYFIRWAAEYRGAFAHYGGDLKTRLYLPTIDRELIYDVDALAGWSSAFHRISSRKTPHNAYSSSTALRAALDRRGIRADIVPGLATRPFKDDAAEGDRPASGSISIPYDRGATTYTYDRATNAYLRSVAGKAHVDAADGKRVVARDVVVLFMALSIDPESEPGYHRPVLAQIGTGRAIVFRDGLAIEGSWKKADAGGLTRFFDKAGAEIPLVRGRIFVQVVATGTKVTWKAG